MSERIKKHELTRRDKEEDRMKHVRINNANVEPVFFAFPDNEVLENVIKSVTAKEAEYDFISPDGFGHHFWVIDNAEMIEAITKELVRIQKDDESKETINENATITAETAFIATATGPS